MLVLQYLYAELKKSIYLCGFGKIECAIGIQILYLK